MIKLGDILNEILLESSYNLIGNCVHGLDDPYFRSKVCYDATEMAGIVDEYSNDFLEAEDFIKEVNWPSDMGEPNDEDWAFAYNSDEDIYWAYNLEDDIHYFFVKDSLKELNTKPKQVLGQGYEHNVFPSLNPDRVIKVGETKYVKKWIKDFESRPDLFPIIYRIGKVKGYENATYVELEKLDTEQFEVDFDVLESILEDKNLGVLEAISQGSHDERRWNEIYEFIKQQDKEIADFFTKLYNNVIQTMPFKQGLFDTYDFHKKQFGYDKDRKVKMLDY